MTFNFSTAGTQANPWIINETISGAGVAPVVLNLTNAQTDAVGPTNTLGGAATGFTFGKWISKTVTNNTTAAWTSFDLELQSVLGTPSTNGDGLSFAQGAGLAFTSTKFSAVHREEELRDFLNFDGGIVNIGESVTFLFAISDNVVHNTIYLSETPNRVVATIPEPETYALMRKRPAIPSCQPVRGQAPLTSSTVSPLS